jgi:hypothetical protein
MAKAAVHARNLPLLRRSPLVVPWITTLRIAIWLEFLPSAMTTTSQAPMMLEN